MRQVWAYGRLFGSLLLLASLSAGRAIADEDIGTGPPIGPYFMVTAFDVEGRPEAVFLAWRAGPQLVQSGLLQIEDRAFLAFPALTTTVNTVVAAGAGGPRNDRRAYVVMQQPNNLVLVVFDADGRPFSGPGPLGSSSGGSDLRIAGTDTGAFFSYSWDVNS